MTKKNLTNINMLVGFITKDLVENNKYHFICIVFCFVKIKIYFYKFFT